MVVIKTLNVPPARGGGRSDGLGGVLRRISARVEEQSDLTRYGGETRIARTRSRERERIRREPGR